MIAQACLASQLGPEVFGITEEVDRALIGEHLLEVLDEEARRRQQAELLERLRGRR